tara:strand:- start:1019 stop:1714 length:696 start_codon:yes stop_codon:yes gene_type:complete
LDAPGNSLYSFFTKLASKAAGNRAEDPPKRYCFCRPDHGTPPCRPVTFFFGSAELAGSFASFASTSTYTDSTSTESARESRNARTSTESGGAINSGSADTNSTGNRAKGLADSICEVFFVTHAGPKRSGGTLNALSRGEFLLFIEQCGSTESAVLTEPDNTGCEATNQVAKKATFWLRWRGTHCLKFGQLSLTPRFATRTALLYALNHPLLVSALEKFFLRRVFRSFYLEC